LLTAYLDESGHSRSTDFFAIAGFVGDEASCSKFEQMWKDTLEETGAPYLHMREFAHSLGPFEGWSEERRKKLLAGCIGAIRSTKLRAVGAILCIEDYKQLDREAQMGFTDPFLCCFQEVIRAIAIVSKSKSSGSQTRTIYSTPREFRGTIGDLHEAMIKFSDVKEGIGSFEFQDMEKDPGLQAADLIAYEFFHYYNHMVSHQDAPPRWPLLQIVDHQRTVFGSLLLKKLPFWYLQLQAAGQIREFMDEAFANPIAAAWVMRELTPFQNVEHKPRT
jgi:hypothetical protein